MYTAVNAIDCGGPTAMEAAITQPDASSGQASKRGFPITDMQPMAQRVADPLKTLVTPLAYDLEVQMSSRSGAAIDRSYGAPLDDASTQVGFGACTLFLYTRDRGVGVAQGMVNHVDTDTNWQGLDLGSSLLSWNPIEGGEHIVRTLDPDSGCALPGEATSHSSKRRLRA